MFFKRTYAKQDSKIERRNWFQRTFLDWHLPWWVNPIVFTVVALGWLFSIYATLLYGVTFTDEQVCLDRSSNVWTGQVDRNLMNGPLARSCTLPLVPYSAA